VIENLIECFSEEKLMLRRLLGTTNDPTLTVVRLILGAVFFAHGAQKMLGWFGGHGFNAAMTYFTHNMGIPVFFAFLAIAAEFFGGLGLLVGLLGRVAAFGILCNMVVAIVMVAGHVGFFMNWFGTQKGEGYEFHLLAIALCVTIIVKGSGAFSVDRALAGSRPSNLMEVATSTARTTKKSA
jgi:putative oxidoreductase